MSLVETHKKVNCYDLRATDRTVAGNWNLYCRKTGERTTEEKCAACKMRQPIRKDEE